MWEHGRHRTCADGLLSTGCVQAILNRAHVRADGSSQFGDLSILDVFPYCTLVFAHFMHDARERHAQDTPLRALEKALDLVAFAESKNCALLGIVELAHAVELLEARRSHAAGTSAAMVRCAGRGADAHGKPHPVAVTTTTSRH